MADPSLADEVAKFKAERRARLRAEYWKQTTNPYTHARGEGGFVFDPAIQRFNSTRASLIDYFKPNFRSLVPFMSCSIIPMLIFGYLVYKDRSAREHAIRTGQVAYRDRGWKFI
ncbi:uncharacterized protein LOC134827843 [Culicoides brevitarsis]|uniref:uncharacterized protein LOC134827843 n=1 Tax=Culicoides brevitarsis TaxID=469753 RepID=UPI00307C14F4